MRSFEKASRALEAAAAQISVQCCTHGRITTLVRSLLQGGALAKPRQGQAQFVVFSVAVRVLEYGGEVGNGYALKRNTAGRSRG